MQTALMTITLGSGKAILMKITSRMIIQKIKWLIRKTNSNHLQSAAKIFKCIKTIKMTIYLRLETLGQMKDVIFLIEQERKNTEEAFWVWERPRYTDQIAYITFGKTN